MISLLDYGAGNVRSVRNAIIKLGYSVKDVSSPEDILRAEKLIFPGVGSFGSAMQRLTEYGYLKPLIQYIQADRPFLGICLGLHALFSGGEEAPELTGFGLFDETVARFSRQARVPHMGWNVLEPVKQCRLLKGVQARPYVYFAHSYYAPVVKATAAKCTYDVPYTALLEHENIFGVQFHPEKSGPLGLKIVKNFVEL